MSQNRHYTISLYDNYILVSQNDILSIIDKTNKTIYKLDVNKVHKFQLSNDKKAIVFITSVSVKHYDIVTKTCEIIYRPDKPIEYDELCIWTYHRTHPIWFNGSDCDEWKCYFGPRCIEDMETNCNSIIQNDKYIVIVFLGGRCRHYSNPYYAIAYSFREKDMNPRCIYEKLNLEVYFGDKEDYVWVNTDEGDKEISIHTNIDE